jgi:flagellar hook-basal body complex protein FliE
MLAELKAATAAAQGKAAPAAGNTAGPDFAQVLNGAIEQVNQAQASAHKMAEEFATGQGNANLQDVMINLQKASLSFQQMTQVRNKLVSAYHDIMNTQV